MANLSNLKLFYTGGGSNSTLTASIGGAISSVALVSQTLTAKTALISGVTLGTGQLNGVGDGTLTYTSATQSLSWQPALGSIGTAVVVSTSGDYFIQGANNGGGISVTVVAASLPTSNTSTVITVADAANKFFADVTKDEADAGVTKYRCIAIKNTHGSEVIKAVKVWINENTPGADTITIALDSLAAGAGSTGPTAIANENTAPSGVTFVNPITATHADVLTVGDLAAGQCRFIWLKEEVPANVSVSTVANTFKFGWSMRA